MIRVIGFSLLTTACIALTLQSCSNKTTSFRSYSGDVRSGGADQRGDQSGGQSGGENGKPGEQTPPGGIPTESERNLVDKNLVWKRYRALERSLMAALQLSKAQLCKESSSLNCVDDVHLFALGGNEPFNKAQYNRLQAPSVTTGVAVDRLVLASCSARLKLDQGGAPKVFTKMPLTSASPAAAAIKAQATELYQRLLLRNPSPEELAVVERFAQAGMTGEKTAKSLCFAIASHAEFLFI